MLPLMIYISYMLYNELKTYYMASYYVVFIRNLEIKEICYLMNYEILHIVQRSSETQNFRKLQN